MPLTNLRAMTAEIPWDAHDISIDITPLLEPAGESCRYCGHPMYLVPVNDSWSHKQCRNIFCQHDHMKQGVVKWWSGESVAEKPKQKSYIGYTRMANV